MIHSELLQFTRLLGLVKYDDTIYAVILDNDSFPNLCGILWGIYVQVGANLTQYVYIVSISTSYKLVPT